MMGATPSFKMRSQQLSYFDCLERDQQKNSLAFYLSDMENSAFGALR